jgi:hypothetical protein
VSLIPFLARAGVATSALGALLASGASGQAPKRGSEFLVNSYTIERQEGAAMAMDAEGDFVLVWESEGQDGNQDGIFAQRFASNGNRLAIEFQVNAYTTGATVSTGVQDRPDVASEENGDFLVVWTSFSQDGNSYGVLGRRFDSSGGAIAIEFVINATTAGLQASPAAAMDADGDFVVAWQSFLQDGSSYGVFARRFDSLGAAQAGEFPVNAFTTNAQSDPDVAMDADGRFLIVWESTLQDGAAPPSIFARRYDASGIAQASEFQVNTYTSGNQTDAAVGSDGTGAFVIAWESSGQDGAANGVFLQRFDPSGTAVAAELQVNTFTVNNQYHADVAARGDGDFLVVWASASQDPNIGIFAQRFTSSGARLGVEFQINGYTSGAQTVPAIAMDDEGDFVVAWQSPHDGAIQGVFAQRYSGSFATLDVDADGAFQPLTDGLLVLRSAFGFTGSTLTSGAVGGGCTRCTAPAIETYLGSIAADLEIDGNGAFQPLTDALLILRHGFGFTGSTLVNGAVGGGCLRCSAPEIESYLAELDG